MLQMLNSIHRLFVSRFFRRSWRMHGTTTALLVLCTAGCEAKRAPVEPDPLQIASVQVSTSSAELIAGQTVTLAAEVMSTKGERITTGQLTWSSSDNAIVTVGASGVATGVSVGAATITASAVLPGSTAAAVNGHVDLHVVDPTLLARRGHAMVYDAVRQRVLLVGGIGPDRVGGGSFDQSSAFAFDGARWTYVRIGAAGMSGRNAFAMTYDAARAVVTIFDGRQGSNPDAPAFGDTWELASNVLTRKSVSGPAARSHVSAAFNPTLQRSVVVGGLNPTTFENYTDQWEWDGATWSQRQGVVVPTANTFGGTLVVDADGSMLLFLSRVADRRVIVYAFSGGQWTQVNDGTGPTASAFATARAPGGGILLFGGATQSGVTDETWKFAGNAWTRVDIQGPPARTGHAMAFDEVRNRVVLFGGESTVQNFADTWEFDGSSWRKIL